MKNRIASLEGAPNHIAQLLMRVAQQGGLSIGALRALSPLPENAQKLIDQAVVKVGVERLIFAQDLLAAGLTFPVPDPLSVMELQWERMSKTGGAQRTMTPQSRGENQLPKRDIKRLPVYLTTDDFSVSIRMFQMAQRLGTPIDTTLVEDATRRVNESIEDAAINGAADVVVEGYTAYGLTNAPNANTNSNSVDWTGANTVGTTGPAIVNDVLAMISALQADKKFGPYNLYVGTKAGNLLQGDFKVNTTDTIQSRVEQIQAGGRNVVVRVADRMPGLATGTQCALVQMTSDVVQMVTGQSPTVIPWTSVDGFTLFWMVLAIMIPRIRDDYDGNSGICLGQKS